MHVSTGGMKNVQIYLQKSVYSQRAGDGEGEDAEAAGTESDKGLEAGTHGAAGGDDVVHQQDMPAPEFLGMQYLKESPHVLGTPGLTHARLVGIVAQTDQMLCIHRNFRNFAQSAGDIE